MAEWFSAFEKFARRSVDLPYAEEERGVSHHPFEERNIHPKLPVVVKNLFDDGHYAQSTFEAFKFVDRVVAALSSTQDSGEGLMMRAFNEVNPLISLTPRASISEKDEQRGYRFMFAGAMIGIRNPRGHEHSMRDTPDECLDHLGLASTLLRRLEAAGHSVPEDA